MPLPRPSSRPLLTRPLAPLVGLLVAVAALVMMAAPASAHAYLVTSNPPDGSVIRPGAQTVWLEFNDELDASLVKIAIIDSTGHAQPPVQVGVDPQRPTRLLIRLPDLPRGVYRISFRVRDSVDLHLTDGTISLGVGTAPVGPPARPSSPPPDWLEVLMRWVGAAGLACMFGALVMAFVVAPRALRDATTQRKVRRTMLSLAIFGAVAALLGDSTLLGYEAASIGPIFSTFSRLLTTSSLGTRWRAESTITTALVVLIAWYRFRDAHPPATGVARWMRGPWVPLAAGALGVADAVAVGFGSHTGGATGPTAVDVTLRAAHLLSVGAWIGGVGALVVTLAVLRRDPDPAAVGAQRAVLRSFSGVAAAGLAAVIATGLLLSGAEVSTITAMLSTWYGAILVAKVALVVVVVLFGWRHRSAVIRQRALIPLRSIALETGVGVVVIGLGAALAATLPARGPQFLPAPPAAPATITANAADLLVQVSVQPNRPGTDLVTTVVSNTRRPAPAPVSGVTLRLSSPVAAPQTVQATLAADGSWSGGQLNMVSGPMTIDATVHRGGLPDAAVTIPFVINPAPAWRQTTVVSSARWSPIAAWAAFAVLVIAVGAGLSQRRRVVRRRRRARAPVAPQAPPPPPLVVASAAPASANSQR